MTTVDAPAQTVAEAYLHLLAARGVDYLFANAGTDFPPIIEALAQMPARGLKAPQAIAIAHEHVAVSMAHGAYLVTGRPQAVMLHVSVGTANAICALMNAAREHVPVLLTAGRTPLSEQGRAGSRSAPIHWAQEMFDQAGMLRELVKWDYELRDGGQVETVVDRALAVAMSEPRGPIYLSLPREVLAEPVPGLAFAQPARIVPNAAPGPDLDAVRDAAAMLAAAKNPLIIAGASGIDPSTVGRLSAFAERFAIPVVEYWSSYLALPTEHPMHLGFESVPHLRDADVVLLLDCDVPWIPAEVSLAPGARVIHLARDPLFSRYPVRGFPCDLGITAPSWASLPALHAALAELLPEAEVAERRGRVRAAHDAQRKAALAAADGTRMTMEWVSRCVSEAKRPDAIVFNEYPLRRAQMSFAEPCSYFDQCSAAGLGFGVAAALGAQLALPDREVIAATGDGSYQFANPLACMQTATALKLPVLTVICNNRAWGAVDRATRAMYPHGAAARGNNRVPLSAQEGQPAYEDVAKACGGHGERVEDPADLPAALQRALAVTRTERRHALLNVICE